ncbi:PhnA-like protein [Microvirga sp. CF3062]|uniref:PhnA-like protein n=1 Tax=Microvirga sp. CF3062 TaxID=3110182 RepID=UPI002E7A4443|nr:PhnA-like protein [Microvirga sp. CF3062]MEE1657053.1 PhnA-like protein [Microvirga sp. CF3062]
MVDHPATPRNLGDKDAPHMSPVTPAEDARTIMLNRISWGAVLAGVVTALVTQLILNMLGIGIGVATLDPATSDNPQASTFSIAAGIWWTLSGIIASFAGGYLAGRLSGRPKESTAGFHGLIAWAATTLVIFYLLTSTLGSLLGGAYNTLSSAVGGLGRTAVQTAAPALAQNPDPFAAIEQQVRGAAGGTDPAQLRDTAVTSLRAMLTGDQAQAQQARDRATDALARAQNIPPEEARNRVTQYEQQYRQTVDRAKQAADTAATGVSTAALLGALGLILGALAGWFGGRAGAVDPTITSRHLAGERR